MSRLVVIFVAVFGLITSPMNIGLIPAEAAPLQQRVEQPRSSLDDFHKGANIDFRNAKEPQYREKVNVVYQRLIRNGVNSICIVFPVFMENGESNDVFTSSDFTPTDEQMAYYISRAHELGFSVMLKPLLDERYFDLKADPPRWRGNIEPPDRNAWHESYDTNVLLRYADIARKYQVEHFVIGTEFKSLMRGEDDLHWLRSISRIRERLGDAQTRLIYHMNWDEVTEFNKTGPPVFFEHLDEIGIDAYFKLEGLGNNAAEGELLRAWQNQWYGPIEQFKALFPNKPIIFTEVGIGSQRDAFHQPWEHEGKVVDLDAQRRYFTATCMALKPIGNGIYWWGVYLDQPGNILQDRSHIWFGKPAESAVNACFRQ